MRTIKFRGKKTTNDVWVYGSFVCSNDLDAAIYYQRGNGSVNSMDWVYVKPETVGQFTGLLDKNGKEIFEGDIIKMSTATYGDEIFRIGYEDSHIGAFCLYSDEQENMSRFVSIFGGNYGYEPFYCEVIGNIHNNKELIKEE